MKKFVPFIVFVFVFGLALATQVANHLLNSSPERVSNPYEYALLNSELVDTQGKKIDLKLNENEIIIVNFWASWCQPCLVELPTLVELQEKYSSEKLIVIGINGDSHENQDKMLKMVKRFKVNFPIVPDQNGDLFAQFKVESIPFSLIFHKQRLIEVVPGVRDFMSDSFLEKIEINLN